jgi:hypothetical protein
MRNSTHIVVRLGVSETKQGLLQDRYSPGVTPPWMSITLDGFLGSGGWEVVALHFRGQNISRERPVSTQSLAKQLRDAWGRGEGEKLPHRAFLTGF